MTDLPFTYPDTAPATGTGSTRTCRRHDWSDVARLPVVGDEGLYYVSQVACARCGKVRDDAAAIRGRRNRRRGKDIERAEMRRAGIHTGNANKADDGLSADGMFSYQSKALASARFPGWMALELDKLRAAHAAKVPVLLIAETAGRGVKGRRLAVVEWADWLDLHGNPEEAA